MCRIACVFTAIPAYTTLEVLTCLDALYRLHDSKARLASALPLLSWDLLINALLKKIKNKKRYIAVYWNYFGS